MKIREVIEAVDTYRPGNNFDNDFKLSLIKHLEARLYNEYFADLNLYPSLPLYTTYANDCEKELLIEQPYSQLYVLYIISEIDFLLDDIERYNNEYMRFNTLLMEYQIQLIKNFEADDIEISVGF